MLSDWNEKGLDQASARRAGGGAFLTKKPPSRTTVHESDRGATVRPQAACLSGYTATGRSR